MCESKFYYDLKEAYLKELDSLYQQEWNARSYQMNLIRDLYPRWACLFRNYREWYESRPDYKQWQEEQNYLDEYRGKKRDEIHNWYLNCMMNDKLSPLPDWSDFPFTRMSGGRTIFDDV
jgi:hypothetical protein